jgi:hypothetical protein
MVASVRGAKMKTFAEIRGEGIVLF